MTARRPIVAAGAAGRAAAHAVRARPVRRPCGLLAIAAVSLPFVDTHLRISALTARLDAAKRQAEESAALQKQIEAELRDRQFLVTRKHQTRSVTELLANLTHLVPDDTWLLMVQITGGQLRISGFSPAGRPRSSGSWRGPRPMSISG